MQKFGAIFKAERKNSNNELVIQIMKFHRNGFSIETLPKKIDIESVL